MLVEGKEEEEVGDVGEEDSPVKKEGEKVNQSLLLTKIIHQVVVVRVIVMVVVVMVVVVIVSILVVTPPPTAAPPTAAALPARPVIPLFLPLLPLLYQYVVGNHQQLQLWDKQLEIMVLPF